MGRFLKCLGKKILGRWGGAYLGKSENKHALNSKNNLLSHTLVIPRGDTGAMWVGGRYVFFFIFLYVFLFFPLFLLFVSSLPFSCKHEKNRKEMKYRLK